MFKPTIFANYRIFIGVMAVTLMATTSVSAFMKSSSEWQKSAYSKAKLHLLDSVDETLNFAIEIELSDKYKTYWHVPGSNGVPPIIELSGHNLNQKEVQLDLPLPKIYKDKYGEAFGYKDKTAFYFSLPRQDASAKTNLKLDFHYATCDVICLPVSASFEMDIASGDQFKSMAALKLKDYKNAIPQAVDERLINRYALDKDKKRLKIWLDDKTKLNSSIFIQDDKSRYYKLIGTSGNQIEFGVFGSKLDNWSEDHVKLYFKQDDKPIITTLISSK